jgi:hypothetical protein
MCLHLEVSYAVDNYGYSAGSVAVRAARRRRWQFDSPAACGCGDSVDLQPSQRPPERRLSERFIATSLTQVNVASKQGGSADWQQLQVELARISVTDANSDGDIIRQGRFR